MDGTEDPAIEIRELARELARDLADRRIERPIFLATDDTESPLKSGAAVVTR